MKIMLAGMVSLLALPPVALAEFSALVTLTTDYIYRGLEQTDGNPALQAGLDFQHDSGWFVGAWASTVDLQTGLGKREIESDFYAGFHYSSESPWSATVTVLHYRWPGATGSHSYDYSELLLSGDWQQWLKAEIGYTNDLYGLGGIGRHWELRAERPLSPRWLFNAGLGGNDLAGIGTSHFLYWDAGATLHVTRFAFDFRVYGNERPDGFIAGPLSAGSQFVLSATASF